MPRIAGPRWISGPCGRPDNSQIMAAAKVISPATRIRVTFLLLCSRNVHQYCIRWCETECFEWSGVNGYFSREDMVSTYVFWSGSKETDSKSVSE